MEEKGGWVREGEDRTTVIKTQAGMLINKIDIIQHMDIMQPGSKNSGKGLSKL